MTDSDVLGDLKKTTEGIKTDLERVAKILEEALSGTSPKSKNSLIKEALKILK